MRPLQLSLLLLLAVSPSLNAPVIESAIEESSSTTSGTTVEPKSPALVTEAPLAKPKQTEESTIHPKLKKLGGRPIIKRRFIKPTVFTLPTETTPVVEGSGDHDEEHTVPVVVRLDPQPTRPDFFSDAPYPRPATSSFIDPPTTTAATEAPLLSTGEHWELGPMMGRWFEAINSPHDSNQKCVVRLFEGLKKNGSSFSVRKMFKGQAEDASPIASLFSALSKNATEEEPIANSIDFVKAVIQAEAGLLLLKSTQDLLSMPDFYYKHGPEVENENEEMQYEYVIMSNRDKYPVTVLARDLEVFKDKYEKEAFQWLEDNGFSNEYKKAFNMIKSVSYSTCEYTEETYETYGM